MGRGTLTAHHWPSGGAGRRRCPGPLRRRRAAATRPLCPHVRRVAADFLPVNFKLSLLCYTAPPSPSSSKWAPERSARLREQCSPDDSPPDGRRERSWETTRTMLDECSRGHFWSNFRAPASTFDQCGPHFDKCRSNSDRYWPDLTNAGLGWNKVALNLARIVDVRRQRPEIPPQMPPRACV